MGNIYSQDVFLKVFGRSAHSKIKFTRIYAHRLVASHDQSLIISQIILSINYICKEGYAPIQSTLPAKGKN